jgi:predicted transcriptional regulator
MLKQNKIVSMKAKGLLSLLTFSEKRRGILLMLQEEPKTLKEIREYLNVTSPEIIPHIRKLEKGNLILQKNKKYVLTDIGEIVTKSFERLSKTLEFFEYNMDFWKEHNINGIPDEFRMRLYELGNIIISKSTPLDIFQPHNEYIKNLSESNLVKGVSPTLHPDYPKLVTMLAAKGVVVSFVVARDVLEKIQKDYKKDLQSFLMYENASLFVSNEDIKVAFTTSDTFLSMRLFLNDNTYDFYRNIICHEKSALKLGEDLFKYYEKRSQKVELQDI